MALKKWIKTKAMHEELNKINKMLFDKIKGLSTESKELDSMKDLLEQALNSWGQEIHDSFNKKDNYDYGEPKFKVTINREATPPLEITGENDSAKEIIKIAKEMKLTDLL